MGKNLKLKQFKVESFVTENGSMDANTVKGGITGKLCLLTLIVGGCPPRESWPPMCE